MRRKLQWYSENLYNDEPPAGGIIFLPGRGGHGVHLLRKYQGVFDLSKIALMSLTPFPPAYGWYPLPNGPDDQGDAVKGLEYASEALERILCNIESEYSLPREKIILTGFSAGAVVGLHHHTTSERPCAAMISHSGAILEPHRVREARHDRPIVLNHSQDDFCFEWGERYVPMKKALLKRGYKVKLAERVAGNHMVLKGDIERLKPFIEDIFDVVLEEVPWIDDVEEEVFFD